MRKNKLEGRIWIPWFAGPGDYSLGDGSQCVDAGENSAPMVPVADITGTPRSLDGTEDGSAIINIGAYEYSPVDINEGFHLAPDGGDTLLHESDQTVT